MNLIIGNYISILDIYSIYIIFIMICCFLITGIMLECHYNGYLFILFYPRCSVQKQNKSQDVKIAKNNTDSHYTVLHFPSFALSL